MFKLQQQILLTQQSREPRLCLKLQQQILLTRQSHDPRLCFLYSDGFVESSSLTVSKPQSQTPSVDSSKGTEIRIIQNKSESHSLMTELWDLIKGWAELAFDVVVFWAGDTSVSFLKQSEQWVPY